MEYASSGKPSRSMIMPLECDPGNSPETHKYIAIDGVYGGGDKRLYDCGTMYIGSSGVPTANTPIAELWVTYEIALFKPIINGNQTDNAEGDVESIHYHFSGVDTAHPFGNAFIQANGSSDRFDMGLDGQSVYASERDTDEFTQYWLIVYSSAEPTPEHVVSSSFEFEGVSAVVHAWAGYSGANIQDGVQGEDSSLGNGTLTCAIISYNPQTSSGGWNVRMSAGFIQATAGFADIIITRLNSSQMTWGPGDYP